MVTYAPNAEEMPRRLQRPAVAEYASFCRVEE